MRQRHYRCQNCQRLEVSCHSVTNLSVNSFNTWKTSKAVCELDVVDFCHSFRLDFFAWSETNQLCSVTGQSRCHCFVRKTFNLVFLLGCERVFDSETFLLSIQPTSTPEISSFSSTFALPLATDLSASNSFMTAVLYKSIYIFTWSLFLLFFYSLFFTVCSSGGSRILLWEGHWQRVWGTEVPQWCPGAERRWRSAAKPPEARRTLRHEAIKPLTEKKEKSMQTDIVWQYHNYHHLIHSSFYVSSHFLS